MGSKSDIEWTDASWTPIRARNLKTGKVGWHCTHASTGCIKCYSESQNRWTGTGLPYKPGHEKDIEIFLDEKILEEPLRWTKPRMVFVCSMTDLFADFVKDEWIEEMFRVMGNCDDAGLGHTFQILTKRPGRMARWVTERGYDAWNGPRIAPEAWPARNIWFGTSAEDQENADARIPDLLNTPAAKRFVSLEPLLGPIDLVNGGEVTEVGHIDWLRGFSGSDRPIPGLDQVIVGGESGRLRPRPMHPVWARSLRDQCAAAGVPFFFKQWGAWVEPKEIGLELAVKLNGQHDYVGVNDDGDNPVYMMRVGKKLAGRTLDGRTHDGMPAP